MHRACGLAYLCFTLSYERRGSPSRAWARQSPTRHPKRVTKVRTGDRAPRLMPLVADRSRDGAPRCASGCDRGPQPPLVYGSARARGYDADRALEALSHRGLPGGRPGVRRKTPARTFQGPLNPPARGRYGILLSRSATRLSRRDVVDRERIVMVEPRRTGMSMSSSGSHAPPRWRAGGSWIRTLGPASHTHRFGTPSCRLRDGPVRQIGHHPFATGYRAFEARFRRRVYQAIAWRLSAGALPTPARVRSPPIGLWDLAGEVGLGRIWLVRRSGQDSTAFECRVLAADRNPVADPMPAETTFPLSEL